MKKRLLLICVILSAVVSGAVAQTLNLSNYSTTVSGTTAGPLTSYVTISNPSSSDFPMMVERTVDNLVAGHIEFFCTSVLCYPPNTDLTTNPDTIIAGNSDVFYGDVIPNGVAGTTTLHYRFFSQDNPADSVGITLNFAFTAVGVNEVKNSIQLSVPNPNPADAFTVFTYSVPASVATDKLVVYNMLGAMVKTIEVPGSNGVLVLNTSEMRPGVYFVSYQNNGKLSGTTKLVVSHR
jgi:hypothetical protein